MGGHLADQRLGEGPRLAGRADQDRRTHAPDHLGQADALELVVALPVGDLSRRSGVRRLEVAQVGPVVGEQPVAAHAPEPSGGHVQREPGAVHRVAQLVGDADAGRARAEHHDPVLLERHATDRARGEDGGEVDRARALHVVVERERGGPEALQDASGVAGAEVLPVQQRVREETGRDGDVPVDERVVLLPLHPRPGDAEVERVVEQLLAVGAHVEHDRERARRVDARGGGVDVELPDRDLDAADSPVADTEDALGVGRDDQVDVVGSAAARQECALDPIGVLDGEVDAARAAVLVAVALDRFADRRRVDDGQHLGQMVTEQPEEQDFVPVVQRGEEDVLRQVRGLGEVLAVGATRLLLHRQHAWRQHADQTQLLALPRGEGCPLVDARVGEHGPTAHARLPHVVGGVPTGHGLIGDSRCDHHRTVVRYGPGGAPRCRLNLRLPARTAQERPRFRAVGAGARGWTDGNGRRPDRPRTIGPSHQYAA